MQHITDREYRILKKKADALNSIKRILNETPTEDEHGNSIPYAYRFDRTISRIQDELDEIPEEDDGWAYQMPWNRSGRLLRYMNAR